MADNHIEKQKVLELTDKLERGLTELFECVHVRCDTKGDFGLGCISIYVIE